MRAILWQTLWGQRIALFFLGAGLFALAMLMPFTFKTMGGMEGLEQLLKVLPEGIRALMKAQGGFLPTVEGYLASGYRHPAYLIIFSAFAIASASGAVAREIERGTILMLLARPVPRHRYLTAKIGALVAGLLLLAGMALAGTWAGVLVAGLWGTVDLPVFLRVQANALLLALAVGGCSLLISALSSDGGRVIALAAGVAVVMFFLDFLSGIWSAISFLGPLSLFHYYDPVEMAHTNAFAWLDLGVLGAVAVAGFGGALAVFWRRDIAR